MPQQDDDKLAESQRSYRWVCPICEETNLGFAAEMTSRRAAVNALKSHIRAVDGDGHGSDQKLPAGVDPETLDRHVEVDLDTE